MVERVTQRFAVYRHNFTMRAFPGRFGPGDETRGQFIWIQTREYMPEPIMTRNAMGQIRKLPQLLGLSLSIFLDVFPPYSPTDDRADGNDENIDQLVMSIGIPSALTELN